MKKMTVLMITLLFCLSAGVVWAEISERGVALLDITARNGEASGTTRSLEHCLKVAGMPYIVTTDPQTAAQYSMIVTSSYVASGTFESSERELLSAYVGSGGILVSAKVKASSLYPLFGLSGRTEKSTRYSVTWAVEGGDPTLHWFDDPNEKTISLGKQGKTSFSTQGYTLTTALPLAHFNDGSVSVTKSHYGSGYAYALGFSYLDLILRNQLDRDYYAERAYSNIFEPTSDTIILFLRAVYEAHVPFAAFKHTAPGTSQADLIMTHDVDSSSGMTLMNDFAEVEYGRGISASYNITTHYFRDCLAKDYYTPYVAQVRSLVEKNHRLGSHSVGHFTDWTNEAIIPLGQPGNTRDTYHPYYDCTKETTIGATVFGEIEVSRQVLETDTGAPVSAFRAGYLEANDKQYNVMDALGYGYSSTWSANDVLTNFPYLALYDRSYVGTISNVYEIPMTISDAISGNKMTADNYQQYVANWLDIINRNAANSAPTVLLIHPNRDFKLLAETELLSVLPPGITPGSLEDFGEYWRARDNFHFTTQLSDNVLTIEVPDEALPLDGRLSLIVRGGQLLDQIEVVKRDSGEALSFDRENRGVNDVIVYRIGQ